MLGTANDAYFKFICDFGPSGPDKAKGGKFLFLPPGYKGEVPDGHFIYRSPSYRIWAMMRGAPDVVGTGDKALEWYKKYLRIYPLETGPRESRAINMSGKGWFVAFRFYGPLEGYIEKTWVLNDIELVK